MDPVTQNELDQCTETQFSEPKDISCRAGGWPSVINDTEVVAEPEDSYSEGTKQTDSFPEGYVESRVHDIRQQYQEGQETHPIFKLEIEQLRSRLLIQPSNLDTFEALSGKLL
jgi:hypothetical protein